MGTMKFQDGHLDCTEIFSIARDVLLKGGNTDMPSVYASGRQSLMSWARGVHDLSLLILKRLAHQLEVSFSTIETLHDFGLPSSTSIRVNHNFPQPLTSQRQASLPGHTDSGTLTILFTNLGGLQILPSHARANDPEAWEWVRPEPGCAVINIGEALAQWTGGLFRSAFHRVLYAPAEQAAQHRYSLGYFLKPADEAPMYCLREGSVLPFRYREDAHDDNLARYDGWHIDHVKRTYRDQPREGQTWVTIPDEVGPSPKKYEAVRWNDDGAVTHRRRCEDFESCLEIFP